MTCALRDDPRGHPDYSASFLIPQGHVNYILPWDVRVFSAVIQTHSLASVALRNARAAVLATPLSPQHARYHPPHAFYFLPRGALQNLRFT